MTKSEFFQLLNDTRHEITVSHANIQVMNRITYREVTLCIPGYALFTLTRHKSHSDVAQCNLDKFTRWLAIWSEEQVEAENIRRIKSETIEGCYVRSDEGTTEEGAESRTGEVLGNEYRKLMSMPVVKRTNSKLLTLKRVSGELYFTAGSQRLLSLRQIGPRNYTPDKKKPEVDYPASTTQQILR